MSHTDTAQAQNTLLFSPPAVNFSTTPNSAPVSQNVNVSINNLPVSSLLADLPVYTQGQQVGWIASVVSTINGSQSFLTINVVNTGLLPGTYNATVKVTAQGIVTTLPISLTIFSSTTLSSDLTTLSFTAQANGPASAPQSVNVNSLGQNSQIIQGVPFTVTSNLPYVTVNASSTVTPSQLTVSVNAAGLAASAAPYTGTITLTSPGVLPVTIAVNVTVSALPSISASPNSVNFLYQSGVGAPPPSQIIQLTSATPLNYVAAFTYIDPNACGGNWLQVTSGLNGVTPSSISLITNLAGLAATQTCAARITVNAPGAANPTLVIPVNLSISPNPQIGVTPASLTFSYSVGTPLPSPQSLTITTSNNTALNYSVAAPNAPWLALPQTPVNGFPSTTPITVGLSQAATALNPGTYNGSIVISSLGSGIAPVNVPVSLTVSNNALLTVTPPILNFNYQTFQTGGTLPAPLSFNIASTLGSLPFALSVPTTTDAQFVSFQPSGGTAGATPTSISVGLNSAVVTALAPGRIYQNVIQVSGTGASANTPPATVQVNLNVSSTPLVNVSPQAIVFPMFTQGSPQPPPVPVSLSSTDSTALGVTVTGSANAPWLLISTPSSPTTPSQFSVTFNPVGLTPGTYNGIITVTSGAQVQQIPVTLTIASSIAVSVSPATPLTFTQASGGAAPPAQTITVNTTANQALGFSVNATTASGGSWLLINGTSATVTGTAPVGFAVSVNGASLAPGTYTGSLIITAINASNPTVTIPVTLTVTPAQSIAVNPSSLTFSGAVAGSTPPVQTLAVTSTTISSVAFSATAQTPSGSWLVVSPGSGTTPATVTVMANQAGLAAGTYTGSVTLTPANAGATPLVVPVTLTVAGQVAPTIVALQNAASAAATAVAPGEIVSLFGSGIGPVTPVGLTLTQAGAVSTNIGNTQVFFDNIAAPLAYVSAGQINAVVPYEVAGKATTQVTVRFNGITSTVLNVAVAGTAPGIFTANGSGSGPGAILNQNLSPNTAANRATAGSVVVIYATGEGVTNPPLATGAVVPSVLPLPIPVAPVTVTIGGIVVPAASIQYAGSAPGFVAGVLQLNVVVPAGIPANAAVPVTISIGGTTSQANVTLALQ